MMATKLTTKQDAFVKAYLLNGGNATQAAISAGYSEKTAYSIGEENLRKPDIRKAIEDHQKEAKKSFVWSKEKKLEKLELIVESSMDICEEEGNFNKGKMYNPSAAIAAIKEHNLMCGDNAPTKSEVKNVKSFSDMYGKPES